MRALPSIILPGLRPFGTRVRAVLLAMLLQATILLVAGGHHVFAQETGSQDTGNQETRLDSTQTALSTEEGEALFRRWLQDQRALLADLESFVIEADVDHRVATPSGERHATYGLEFTRFTDGTAGRGTLRYFVIDGDSLDVSEQRRVQRIISSMMTDELGPLLNGLTMPSRLLSRVHSVGTPVRLERDGRSVVRFVFELDPPVRAQPRVRRPGMRPGFPPPGRRLPPGGRIRPDGPRPRIAVFIDEDSGRLMMTRIRATLPGERMLMAETTFQREQGVDFPLSRHVAGDIAMRRRLRTVTVSLDHRTSFRVERLSFSDR